ncbi:MAG: leucyl aminopeptidase [Planctomycetota bacterium]
MRISSKNLDATPKTDLLALFLPDSGKPQLPEGVKLPKDVLAEFEGKFRSVRLVDPSGGSAKRIALIGLGSLKSVDPDKLRRAAALAVQRARGAKLENLAIWVEDRVAKSVGEEVAGQAIAEGARMAAYSLTKFKGKQENGDKDGQTLKTITISGSSAAFRRGVKTGDALGEANCFTRELQDAPGNKMRPRDLVSEARKLARRSQRITASALTEAQMQKLGMGSLLSVSRGSEEPAFLIHLVYKPKTKAKKKIAFVGKGLTFDAGGISIKPSAKMDEMKYDMSGGAAVLGVFHALAALDVPYEVHGFVPTSENLPDGKANKPGDVVTASNGKTIEVLNTDAEGRLILADALSYASKKVKPDVMVDLATLTGSIVVALGHELTGLFSKSDSLAANLLAAGEASAEACWRMPILDVHLKHMKGRIGDLRNINSGQGAGSSGAAAFLNEFVGEGIDWAHLDIAGAAWGAEQRDYQGGPWGTGVGVRLLLEYLRNHAG